MDYKVNILTQGAEYEENLLPDIAGLNFVKIGNNVSLFDYTAYLEHNKLDAIDYKVFLRYNRHYIERLIQNAGIKTSDVVYQNTDGHILLYSDLVIVFLAFVNPEMLLYFQHLLIDALTKGVAYSMGYIYELAGENLPEEELMEIIKERKNET